MRRLFNICLVNIIEHYYPNWGYIIKRRTGMANNILNEGKETLKKIYEEVKDLGQNELREKELMAAEDNTEKALADKEKAVAKEIADTIKKRREEIIKTFDLEEDKLTGIAKKTSQKREKYRDGKVSERISTETINFIEANKQIKEETKKLYKQTKTPGFFNSGLYYTLFMPGSLKDMVYCFLAFLIFFAGVPSLIWYFLPNPIEVYMIVLMYLACIAVFAGLYIFIFSVSRSKYRDTVFAGNNARKKIRNNKKVIAKISNSIRKDEDDSHYGLENYNAQLEDLQIQLEDLAAKRKEALRVFDESTKKVVTDEIQNTNQSEIDGYKTRLAEITADLSGIRAYIKQRKIFIAENYEVFLSKEMVDAETLKDLIEISEKNPNASIGELIELYKQPVSEN